MQNAALRGLEISHERVEALGAPVDLRARAVASDGKRPGGTAGSLLKIDNGGTTSVFERDFGGCSTGQAGHDNR